MRSKLPDVYLLNHLPTILNNTSSPAYHATDLDLFAGQPAIFLGAPCFSLACVFSSPLLE
jgi:hypothetical protein